MPEPVENGMQISGFWVELSGMNALAAELDHTLRTIDTRTAVRLERLVRDALELAKPPATAPKHDRERWLERLDRLRESVGTGKPGTSTEVILEDLRGDRS